MNRKFEGKVALVTGAASGIGRITALALANHGASVALADLNTHAGLETLQLIQKNGGKGLFVTTDVTQASQVEGLISEIASKMGGLDFALNNAGIDGTRARTADYPEKVWREVIDINLTGVFLCLKYEIPLMLQKKAGAIVNPASVAGLTGFPGHAAYTASKH